MKPRVIDAPYGVQVWNAYQARWEDVEATSGAPRRFNTESEAYAVGQDMLRRVRHVGAQVVHEGVFVKAVQR